MVCHNRMCILVFHPNNHLFQSDIICRISSIGTTCQMCRIDRIILGNRCCIRSCPCIVYYGNVGLAMVACIQCVSIANLCNMLCGLCLSCLLHNVYLDSSGCRKVLDIMLHVAIQQQHSLHCNESHMKMVENCQKEHVWSTIRVHILR